MSKAEPVATAAPQARALINIGDLLKVAQQLPILLELLRSLGILRQGGGAAPVDTTPVPPPAPSPPAPPIQVPGGTPIPQTPIVLPLQPVVAGISLRCTSVEKPRRVGGGPGVNYEDHQGMIARGEAFNYGCVSFWNGQLHDADGDEIMGPTLVKNDLEFRAEYRIYKNGTLVAAMGGQGDDNPTGEGRPAPWHQAESEGVGFGVSRWLNSAGLDNRIVFRGEGDFEVELAYGDMVSARVPIKVS